MRSTISYLRELPQQVPTHSFTFTAPPSRVFTTSPSPTMWVPAWAYAGAASLAGLALALLVLVDATGFPTSSTSQTSGRVTAQSYTSFGDALAEKQAAPAGPDQYPSAPIPQAAPAEALPIVPVVPATPAAASAVQSEVAAAQEKKIVAEIPSTPAPAALAQAEAPAAAPTPTSPMLAVAEVTAATEPLEAPGSPATPTPSLSGQAAEVDATGPARRAAGGGAAVSGPSGLPPPLVITPAPATPAVLPTKVPPPTGARPTPGREEQDQPTAEAGDRVRLAAVPGSDSGPMPEEQAGPAGPAGPPSQGAESVGPGLADSAIDSRREVVAPRRMESGSRWRVAQGIAAALALIFIGGLLYEVRRDRHSALL